MVEVVIQQGCDKVICRGDGVEVARKVKVDILRWEHLSMATTRSTTLHTEAWAERGLTQGDYSLLADVVKAHTEANAHGSLTHTRLCCGDGCYEDKVVLSNLLIIDEFIWHLSDILAIAIYIVLVNTHLCSNVTNILEFGLSSNLNI